MLKLKQSTLDKAFAVTSFFEGGYCAISGNFDGQGLSVGFLQWNFGQGTLQPLFIRLFNEFPDIADVTLPEGGKWLKDAIENNYVMQWVKEIQVNNRVVDPWKSALYKLCQTEPFIQIQKDAAETYVNYAINMCNGFNLITDRAYSLMFDIAVQCGPISSYDLAEPTYIEKLQAVADAAIRKCSLLWQDDVRKRKYAIINGKDMGRGWAKVEFDDQAAFETEEKEPDTPQIVKSINILNSCEVITDTSYWVENCVSGGTIDGAYMQILINRFTAMYVNGLQTQEEVVKVLMDKGIVNDASYWVENAVPSRTVEADYAMIVMKRMAELVKG